MPASIYEDTPTDTPETNKEAAFRLTDQDWHSLSAEDTALVIKLQHVHGLLQRATRIVPERGHGLILVGPLTIPA